MTTTTSSEQLVYFGPADDDEYRLRLGKIREQMRRAEIEAAVVYSSVLSPNGVSYVSNYEVSVAPGTMLHLGLDTDPVLYVVSESERQAATATSWVREIAVEPDLADVARRLIQKDPDIALVGFDSAPRWLWSRIKGEFVNPPRHRSGLLETAARVKTPREIEVIRRAAYLADEGFRHAAASIVEGIAEFEIAAELELTMRSLGATDNFGLLSVGPKNTSIGFVTDYRAKPGDIAVFEITPALQSRSYSAQLCRTVSLGPPSALVRAAYPLLREALEAAIDAVRPGALASDIVKAQDDVFIAAGYAEYCRPPYMRARGHGFGLGRIDLDADNDEPLEAGVAMVVHPNQFLPEPGYLALGDMLIVTEDGCERLSSLTTELTVV